MKKIVSLMLSAIFALSSITVATADTSANGVNINRWNGFVGDGVTVSNPADSSDDVIKLKSGEETTLSLDSTVSGNTLITVDFYAETAQNSTITALASDGTTVMGSFAISKENTETGKWQTAKILVYPNGKMYRTYIGDTYIGEGAISTPSLQLGKIKFSAGGDLYINNISVSDFTVPLLPDSKLISSYSSNFSETTSTTEKISSLDGWSCSASDNTIGYYLVPDPVNSAENAVKIARTATNTTTNRFVKSVNMTNSLYEMKIYLPSKLDDNTTDNPANFKLFFRTDNSVNPTVIWALSDGVVNVGSGNGKTTVPQDEWFTLKINISTDAQTIDVYINEEKASSEPISLLKDDGTPAGKCSEIDFEIVREQSCGVAYVKDIAIKEQNTVKVEGKADKTVIYDENFDDEVVGAAVPGFIHGSSVETDNALTFTTASTGTAGATSNVGMLFDPSYTDSNVYRYTDAGESDTTAIKKDSKSQEWWYYDISDKTADLDNITLSFKYYNAKNAGNNATYSSALSRDHLFAGFATDTGDIATGNLYHTGASSITTYMKPGISKVALMQNASRSNGTNVLINTGAWTNLSLTITKNADGTATAKIKSGTAEDTYSLASFPTISKLSFQLEEAYGGKYYLDDIEVYSAEYTEEVLYTENELMDISTAVTVPVYTNTITRNNVQKFTVDSVIFSDGSSNLNEDNTVSGVELTQWKALDENENAYLYVVAYDTEGRYIASAVQNVEENALSVSQTKTVTGLSCEGAEYVKVFIWSDDLTPLAESYFVGKNITVWIAGASTAQTYTAERYPQTGWGQVFDKFLYGNSVTVQNKAIGGRSTKSFISEGRLDEILAAGKAGDYLMIFFGGNDASKTGQLEYTDPTLGSDVVDSNPNGYSEDASYKYYLKQYTDGAKEKGMIPILVTPISMYGYSGDSFIGRNYVSDYVTAMKELGAEENVPVIDVNAPFDGYNQNIGSNESAKLYMIFNFSDYADDPLFSPDYHLSSEFYNADTGEYKDITHLTLPGAEKCAEIIADILQGLQVSLSNYVK